ncbi:hypothetical protein SELMODRAFT_427243 [Selaginella moellendorffii]|uniref:Uncharacterized protein n=1 Tax=Selaginella moellendorffii TaxID=88036 RepID=D8SYZ9_SELML|nr:hypothetical protein SELMODRAFT_427243 [Selaginella moellendorffii]
MIQAAPQCSVVKEALLQGGLDQQELSAFTEEDLSKLWRAGFVNTAVLKKASAYELPVRYALSFWMHSAIARGFGVGLAVTPESNYFVEPGEIHAGLRSDLEAGKYCALLGPRQSGKTTAAMAVMRQMMDSGLVYPTVRDLLDGRYGRKSLIEEPRRLSPLPHDYYVRASGFDLDDIVSLLEQANEDYGGAVKDVKEIAASVFELTSGHKGLVGVCLAFMLRMELFTIKDWRQSVRSYELRTYIFDKATYWRIMDSFNTQARSKEGYERVMGFVQAVEKPYQELESVQDLLAEGVLAVKRQDPQCVITSEEVEDPPVQGVVNGKWVIMQVLQTMEECQNQAEYALQFAFMCRLKAVLVHAYPMRDFLVLPEVKEKIDASKPSQKRLDTLVKDGTKGFELLVNCRREQLAECMQRAKRNHEQHGKQVFVVDFLMDVPAIQTRPDHDGVIYVGVRFQREQKGCGDLY